MQPSWITNDPTFAARLKTIERRYESNCRSIRATPLSLAKKIDALRKAREVRDAMIEAMRAELWVK